ncbi:endospore germination permease [Brevibacillus sp. GCM10020057]|uniref:GerAB/ArcD/ProY family transporter n=1 Tax=Brevibacillus sp. GCM10020057 TaxID=3317327 RepID=UPI00362E28F7
MLEKGKISALQSMNIMFFAVVASSVMWAPGITGKYAHNDMWLSPFWAMLPGFLTVFIALRLHKLYPQMTVVEYSQQILGKFLGKGVSLVYIFFYTQLTGTILRNYADFISSNFLSKTPISVVIITIVIVSAFAVSGGLEVIGRTAQLFFPIFLTPLFFMFMLLQDMHIDFLFPVLEHGIFPSIKGSVIPGGWLCEMFLLSFLLPFIQDHQNSVRTSYFTVVAIVGFFFVENLFILLVLGRQSSDFFFPVMVAFRYISVADFFENLESLVMAIWILGMFVKISFFYYVSVLGFSQWFGVSDYRPLVLPLGFWIVVFSFWSFPNFDVELHFDTLTFPFYSVCIQLLLPLMLLVGGVLRKRRQTAKQMAGKQ